MCSAEVKSLLEDLSFGDRIADWSQLRKMLRKLSEIEEIKQYLKTFLFAQETAQR